MSKYVMYCDESTGKGRFYSDFYGGAIVDERLRLGCERILKSARGNCRGEMKWTKISEYNENDYICFINAFFDLIRDDFLKVRIMFRQNTNKSNISGDAMEKYTKLYYQFIKHAFGLQFCNPGGVLKVSVSVFLDKVPITPLRFEQFRDYIINLSNLSEFKSANIRFSKSEVTDVLSENHIILQAVDVVLGSIQFRLNDKHKEIPLGKKRRAKRTRAKERVYKIINLRIREIYPHFNVGVGTSMAEGRQVRWTHRYRHWNFIPNNGDIDLSAAKSNSAAPRQPTNDP